MSVKQTMSLKKYWMHGIKIVEFGWLLLLNVQGGAEHRKILMIWGTDRGRGEREDDGGREERERKMRRREKRKGDAEDE